MTKEDICVEVAAVLTALHEEPNPVPEVLGYMALGCGLSRWEQLKGLLVESGLLIVERHTLRLTAKGHETAEKCEAAMAK